MASVPDEELERIRKKVEAGEPLTDAEFSALEHAARAQGGPTLRLAVAHALLDKGESRDGLAMMERLARDFPRDVQIRLGHARALVGQERYGDAERALLLALALNPGDPEALKALAVVALRRGEVARARGWVAEVLRKDPFDAEARLLKEELEAADPGGAAQERTAFKTEFIGALLRKLEEKGVPHLRHGRDVLVRLNGGGVARVELGSLYTGYLDSGRPLAEAVENTATELDILSLGVPESRQALLSDVLPVLRAVTFQEKAGGSVGREGPAGLMIYYVLDHPEMVRYLPRMVVESGRATLEELDQAAWENLGKRPPQIAPAAVRDGSLSLSHRKTGLWMLGTGDGHDGARLLCEGHREFMQRKLGPGPYRVSLGHRELVLLCRESDEDALAQLESYPAVSNGIPGIFRLEPGGRLTALG